MKKLFIYVIIAAAAVFASTSCQKESELSPESVIKDSVNAETEFDAWLEENFRKPYNISIYYRYNDIETNHKYELAPARELYCRILAKMVKYLWIEPYTEVTSTEFMRIHAPRVIQMIGSAGYNSNGSYTLGTAEGGQKITLYIVNKLEEVIDIVYDNGVDETGGYHIVPKNLDEITHYYFKTIHHEFAHIFNQKVTVPVDFRAVSGGAYNSQWTSSDNTEAVSARNGFISRYASSAYGEDFAETLALYVTWNDEQLKERLDLATVTDANGNVDTSAADQILRKIEICKDYCLDVWKLDLDALRTSIHRRYYEMESLDWSDFSVSNK